MEASATGCTLAEHKWSVEGENCMKSAAEQVFVGVSVTDGRGKHAECIPDMDHPSAVAMKGDRRAEGTSRKECGDRWERVTHGGSGTGHSGSLAPGSLRSASTLVRCKLSERLVTSGTEGGPEGGKRIAGVCTHRVCLSQVHSQLAGGGKLEVASRHRALKGSSKGHCSGVRWRRVLADSVIGKGGGSVE